MRRFIARHLDKIIGVLEGFDRLMFRGWLGCLCHESGMYSFFASQGVLLKDFEPFAKTVTTSLRAAAEKQPAKLQRQVHYPTASLIDKVASGGYLASMRSVGLKELKNKLSEYVRMAARGETVLVTDRDRVVAELNPPREGRSPMLADAVLADAVRKGWLTPPAMPQTSVPDRRPVASLSDLLSELDHDRGDR